MGGRVDGGGVGDAREAIVPGVGVGLDLCERVGDRLQPAGGGLVGVGDGAILSG